MHRCLHKRISSNHASDLRKIGCCLHKIFQHGPGFAQHLLHMEFQYLSHSWISGLFADIIWLRSVLPDCVPEDWTHTLTGAIEFWQSGAPGWKAMIKRAGKRHLFQEAMMADVFSWHRQLFRVLGKYGATFDPSFFGKTVSECEFHCACGRHFDTAQGLSTHRRKAHGIFSLEHDLLNGATCPVCMVHFWTTQRLQQHVSYISRRTGRNACYQVLRKSGYAVDYERVHFPSRVRGLNRIEAIPCEGPQGIFSPVLQTQIVNWRQEISSLLRDLDNITLPPDPVQSVNLLCDGLTSTTRVWFQRFCDHSYDLLAVGPLEDHWFDYLATWPHELDDWFADEFLQWGQTHLQDLIAEFVDGEAERIADEAFYEISKDMPRCQMRDRVTFLNRCIARAESELAIDVQHRPPFDAAAVARARARKDDPDAIFTTCQQQTDWHNEVRKIKWDTLPKDAATPMTDGILAKPIFLIVHLFSGRRRPQDVHWHLAKLAEERGIEVAVLSMDTAVSPYYGDLTASSVSWQKLAHLYEQGFVAATVCGAPCETFSAARHVPPPEDLPDKEKLKWPRPLRTFARLFGLDGLRPKELRQCRQGSAFMFQALWHAHGTLYWVGSSSVSIQPPLMTLTKPLFGPVPLFNFSKTILILPWESSTNGDGEHLCGSLLGSSVCACRTWRALCLLAQIRERSTPPKQPLGRTSMAISKQRCVKSIRPFLLLEWPGLLSINYVQIGDNLLAIVLPPWNLPPWNLGSVKHLKLAHRCMSIALICRTTKEPKSLYRFSLIREYCKWRQELDSSLPRKLEKLEFNDHWIKYGTCLR